MTKENPVEASIKWLIECGYTETEAENLVTAIQDASKEMLWELAPKWVQHVGDHKRYQTCMLDLVAKGIIKVTANADGEWLFQLNDDGIDVAKQLSEST